MHIVLTGATGLVGSSALAYILNQLTVQGSRISRLTILSRRPVPMAEEAENPNVKTIIHKDWTSYPPELLSELRGAHGVVWAMGISQNEVSKEDYIKITRDYTMAAANAFKDLNGPEGINFVYVSGEGATPSPGRFTALFGRVKGETELRLVELNKANPQFRPYNGRPGAVDPTGHAEVMKAAGSRRTGMLKLGGIVLMPIIKSAYKSMHSPTKELGKSLVELALSDGAPLKISGVEADGRTVNNAGLRVLAGI